MGKKSTVAGLAAAVWLAIGGALPAHAGQDVCRTLMQTNFMMFGKSSPVLGLGRDDRLVLHMVLRIFCG